MWTDAAQDVESLARISVVVHDARFDGSTEDDPGGGVVVVRFCQEGWPEGPPGERTLVRETWRYREYRVAFYRSALTIAREWRFPTRLGAT